MPAQGLGDVRVGGRQFGQQREELGQRGAEAAVLDGDPQGPEARLGELADLRVREHVVPLPDRRTLGDAGKNGTEPCARSAYTGAVRVSVAVPAMTHGGAALLRERALLRLLVLLDLLVLLVLLGLLGPRKVVDLLGHGASGRSCGLAELDPVLVLVRSTS